MAPAGSITSSMELGYGPPMGPLRSTARVGLEVR